MSKNFAKIPPPNVRPDQVSPGDSLMPRPGDSSSQRSFNLEQAVNVGPLDTSNAPEDSQQQGQQQQQQQPSDGTRPEHLTATQASEPTRTWEAGDEERVQRFATSAGAQASSSSDSSAGADSVDQILTKKDQEKLSGADDGGEEQSQQRGSQQRSAGSVHPGSESEVYEAMDVLNKRLPPELVAPIIDFAEYYVQQVIGSRHQERSVSNSTTAVYLTCRIPDFEAFNSDTEGKGGRQEEVTLNETGQSGEGHPVSRKVELGRQGRIRKLIFKTKSHDQGWTSNKGMGTYCGSFSWLEVELYRKKEAVLAEKVARASKKPMAEKTAETEDAGDDATGELSSGSEADDNTPMDGMVKIDSHYLQVNVHGKRQSTEHEVVWDNIEDQLDDEDPEKWENDGVEGHFYKNGHLSSNGAFVRQLRGGDELRVIMKCMYPGWSCTVESCEVQAVWAV